jgi:hypothetical protein
MARIGVVALLLGAVGTVAGCSDDSGSTPSPLAVAQTEEQSGDAQIGPIGQPLDDALRVVVTRDGQPVEDVEVQWLTTTGGSFTQGTTTTDANGVATATWILGPEPGDQAASARVVGAEGSPVLFSATAFDPGPPGGGGGGGEPLPLRIRIIR